MLGVYDSQISGGKRYNLAAMGRRRANATFYQSHDVDSATQLSYAMYLTPLIHDDSLEIVGFVSENILAFQNEVVDLLRRYLYR